MPLYCVLTSLSPHYLTIISVETRPVFCPAISTFHFNVECQNNIESASRGLAILFTSASLIWLMPKANREMKNASTKHTDTCGCHLDWGIPCKEKCRMDGWNGGKGDRGRDRSVGANEQVQYLVCEWICPGRWAHVIKNKYEYLYNEVYTRHAKWGHFGQTFSHSFLGV